MCTCNPHVRNHKYVTKTNRNYYYNEDNYYYPYTEHYAFVLCRGVEIKLRVCPKISTIWRMSFRIHECEIGEGTLSADRLFD